MDEIRGASAEEEEKIRKKARRLEVKMNQKEEALGRGVAGLSTKIHMACVGNDKPVAFVLTGGEAGDAPQFDELMNKVPQIIREETQAVIGDMGYESDAILKELESEGIVPVIPPRPNRIDPHEFDEEAYKERNWIERLFNATKRKSRRVATRYEKLGLMYAGMVTISCILMWLL